MVQKIGNPVQCNRGLSAPCPALYHKNLILCVTDNGILFFLDCPHNIFQLNIAVMSKFLLQDLIINLGIALKSIYHLSSADLILPFGADLACDRSRRCFIGSRPFIIIIEQPAHRSPPVVDKRRHTCLLGKISNSDIKWLRLIFSLKYKVNPPEKRRILHPLKPVLKLQLLCICIRLLEKGLTVVIFLITILIHLRIVLPVILMHIFNFFFTFIQIMINLIKSVLYLNGHILQKLRSA